MATSAELPFPSSSSATAPEDDLTGMPSTRSSATGAVGSEPGGMSGSEPHDTPRGDDLLGRVVQGAHSTIDRLAESAAPHVQRLQEGMSSANETLHARAGQVREVGDEWAESLRSTVRENPLAAVATALALGVLIARVTR